MTSTFVSYTNFQRTYGRPLREPDLETIQPGSQLDREADYFRENIGRVSSGAELAADRRLFEFALTAFGLTDQIDNPSFIVDVLDQGVFDPFTPFTANSSPSARANPINQAAEEFWFSDEFILPSLRADAIDQAVLSIETRYRGRSGNVPPSIVDAEVAYFNSTVRGLTSGEQIVSDPRLFDFVVRAFDLQNESGNGELIAKAIDAGVYNPGAGVRREDSLANTVLDSRINTFARAFAFNEIGDRNVRDSNFVETVVRNYQTESLETQAKVERAQNTRRNALPDQFARDIDYFRENIGNITTGDELVEDERLYRFVLTAYDLESQIPSRALIRKVLNEGVTSDDALANQLTDTKFRIFARDLGFAEVGSRNVRNPNFVDDVIERFTRVTAESNAGEDNLGVRLAAYFDRQAPNVTNWFAALGDRALREVLFVAFDLPDEMQTTNPDRLVAIFEQRFDIEDFQDPEKLNKFIQRFTALYDVRNGAPGGAGSNVLSLYGISPEGEATGSGIIAIDPQTRGAIF